MVTLRREVLLAWDSRELAPLASQLRQQGWQLVRQSLARLKPEDWPPVGVVELRSARQRQQLEPCLSRLRQGHYVAITDAQTLQCEHMQHLIANGFHDYFTLPCNASHLSSTLGHALGMSALHPPAHHNPGLLQGNSAQMRQLREHIELFAQVDMPVLLLGESGAGKECAARLIHQHGQHRHGRFVAVNCAAIPDTLFAAELFGHEKGAFTGAGQGRQGRVHDARGGTLFLDEVGDMSAASQTTLLRFLESGEYCSLGSNREQQSSARIICASNRPLEEDVQQNRFRLDLYHRINVLQLNLPPLREHPEDIEELANHLLAHLPGKHSLSTAALQELQRYRFPGNVRELYNCLKRASVISNSGLIEASDLQLTPPVTRPETIRPLQEFREQQEKGYLRQCLASCQGDMSQTARILGISRSSLYRMVDKYELTHLRHNHQTPTGA